MFQVFGAVPRGFFNCLASGSNQQIYADCLQLIYREYEREISYRIPRNRIRDVLALYFLEHHVSLSAEEGLPEVSTGDMASAVLRKFCSKEVGWLEEETDDATYEKQILMTEQGIALAEFLNQLEQPEKEEFSSYIFNIFNTLSNEEQWKENPYAGGIRNVYRNARSLSKSLKKLSTFIRKIIEKMVQEETLESLTENILAYCEGDFIREYARLTKQQNIHIYRNYIKGRLDEMLLNGMLMEQMAAECAKEEELSAQDAEDHVYEMIQATRRFLVEDYDRIMSDIKHKINVYLQIAVGRARFLRNREQDVRGNVEKTLHYLISESEDLGIRETLPSELDDLFLINPNEYLDENSLFYPRKNRVIRTASTEELEELTPEALAAARAAQEKEAYNPYSKDKMKRYLQMQLNGHHELISDTLPMENKQQLLADLASVAYAADNGYRIEPLEGYYETEHMILRRFRIIDIE